MARVTVEDCLERVGNHFALVILAAGRARQLAAGAPRLVECANKSAVIRMFVAERKRLDGENRLASKRRRHRES